jgi:DNA repair protein SbcD/Mre11
MNQRSLRILHFADAHIDMANYGRHDAASGLPVRVMDFLKSLDTIVNTAIDEQVDLVLFAGDAFKDRTPAPTFQREWGRRLMRLARAGIPTLLLVGNHDIAPALGRAHAMESFDTLEVPHIKVIDSPKFLGPKGLEDLPLQVLALPWVSRSGLMAHLGMSASDPSLVYEALEQRLTDLINGWIEQLDSTLPAVLTAHCSVQGAKYGGERMVMLGADLVLPASLVKNPRLDYVALGHIHKAQNLNENAHPPVIYPGSIERVDWGEAGDDKFFVIATVRPGHTEVDWRKLDGVRPFFDRHISIESDQDVMESVRAKLPDPEKIRGAYLRLVIDYPKNYEPLIDEAALRQAAAEAFEFQLVKRPQIDSRARLPEDLAVGSLTPLELLERYWGANHTSPEDAQALNELAARIIQVDAGP